MGKCVRFMGKRSVITALIAIILVSFSIISWKPATSASVNEGGSSASVKKAAATASGKSAFDQYISSIYDAAGLGQAKLDPATFHKALVGYLNLRKDNKVSKPVLTIVDFNRPSTEKRMWIIDLQSKKLLFHNLVAHGQGSGDNFATNFSNTAETHSSSVGFYVTSQTYQGKHGLSLKLKGMDNGFNTNAENRSIVLHGAEYVSQSFIDAHGRLGRSFGCPAVPTDLTPAIIQAVKGQSCLFINGPATGYSSSYLDEARVLPGFFETAGV